MFQSVVEKQSWTTSDDPFVGTFVCGVNIAQDIAMICRKVDMSIELWKHLLGLA